jgi:hypothetical protein
MGVGGVEGVEQNKELQMDLWFVNEDMEAW